MARACPESVTLSDPDGAWQEAGACGQFSRTDVTVLYAVQGTDVRWGRDSPQTSSWHCVLFCHVFYSNEPADSICVLHLIHLNIKHPVYLLSWF